MHPFKTLVREENVYNVHHFKGIPSWAYCDFNSYTLYILYEKLKPNMVGLT